MIPNWVKTIKQAVLRATRDDTAYPRAQVTSQEKPSTALLLSPYGICARAPDGSFAVTLDCQCDPSVQVAIAADIQNRFKDLKQGEVVVFNTLTPDSHVYLKANGDVDIKAESGVINLLSQVVAHNDVVDSVTGATAFTHHHLDSTGNPTGQPLP